MIPEAYQSPQSVLDIWGHGETIAGLWSVEDRAIGLTYLNRLIRKHKAAWARAVRGK